MRHPRNYSAADVVRIQREVGQIARYTIDMGGDIELFEIAMRVPPWERLRTLSSEELARTRLHTADAAFGAQVTGGLVRPADVHRLRRRRPRRAAHWPSPNSPRRIRPATDRNRAGRSSKPSAGTRSPAAAC